MKLALLLLASATVAHAEPLPTTELRLPNGTVVVLAPDPSVADVVVYASGGADATALDAKLDSLGGWSTADTLEVPSEALPYALFLDAQRFTTAPPLVVIAGRFSERGAGDAITAYFGSLRAARPHPVASATPGPGAILHQRHRPRATFAFAMPDPLTAERLDLDVAARILTSRGLQVDPPFTIEGPTRDAIVLVLRNLRDLPITADDLARALAMAELEQIAALEGLAYRARAIADAITYDHTPRYLEHWRARLHAVTPASVQATARRWLDDAHAVITIGDQR